MREDPTKLPVFVSCPNDLTPRQQASADVIRTLMQENSLESVSLERWEYPLDSPFDKSIERIAQCSGGLILGFTRLHPPSDASDLGKQMATNSQQPALVSSWLQIEGSAMLARGLPMLVLREHGVSGGIFDPAASSSYYLLHMPEPNGVTSELRAVFVRWAEEVQKYHEAANSMFDVFLSFSGEDEDRAREVFEYLANQGLRVFFSRESIPQLAQADYMKAINTALDKARHMIVLSSSAAGFAKPWVEREWTMFLNEKLSGRKSGNIVVVQGSEIPVADLPIALRSQQVVPLNEAGLLETLKFVSKGQG
jgi:hypothetical protein